MKEKTDRVPIRAWAEGDQPREKLLAKGRHVLSNAELVAILIGSGNTRESAVELSRRILRDQGDKLEEFSKRSIGELLRYKGVGMAKAVTIAAAMELGKRRREEKAAEKKKITDSEDVHDHMYGNLADLPHEEFWILMLDRANQVIGKSLVSRGGVNGTIADPRLIFKQAVERLASSLVLCHNHPSGNLQPSKADRDLTQKLKKAGEVLDIPVLDHLILAGAGYYSFADEGEL